MSTGPPPLVGLELLPDWTPSANPRLVRFDAVVKVAARAAIPPGTELRVRLISHPPQDGVLVSNAELGGLVGPHWREVRGRLLDVDPAITTAEGLLDGSVSAPVFRRDAEVPVTLTVFRDMIGVPREPVLWWRYHNSTSRPVNVRQLRAETALSVDDRLFRLTTNYNGPAELPPGRAVSGLWSFDDADGLRPGTYQVRLTIGDEASERLTMTIP